MTGLLTSSCQQLKSTFGDFQEARSVFLELTKVFDKAWQKSLIFKLKQNSKLDNLYVLSLTSGNLGNKDWG